MGYTPQGSKSLVKPSVRAATTANITLSGTQTIDGVSLVADDRVLVKDQSVAADNGLYIVAAGAWARAMDANQDAEVLSGDLTYVQEGTDNGTKYFSIDTVDPIIVGTTALSYVELQSNSTQISIPDDTTQAFTISENANEYMRIDTNNGTESMRLGIAGSEAVRIDAAGNVGVGTTTPSVKLDVDGDVRFTGNLTVEGSTTTVGSETVLLADNHLYLNNGYTTVSAETAGLVANYLPTATADTVAGSYVAGVPATSNPTVVTTGSGTFSTGDLIQFSGSNDNDGLFEVLTHTGTTLTIRGIGTTSAVEDFTQNQFVAGATDGATITQVNVSIIRAGTDGNWEVGAGSSTPISFADLGVGSIGGSGTAAHIAYFTAGTTIASESAGELYWDATNNRLGLGTETPVDPLHVVAAQNITRYSATAATSPEHKLRRARGSEGAESEVQSADSLGQFLLQGYDTSGYGTGARVEALAEGTWTASSYPTSLRFSTVASGSTSLVEAMRIDADGNLGLGNIAPNTVLDVDGAFSQRGMAAPAVSVAGQGRIYFDSTSNKFRVSENNGAYVDLIDANAIDGSGTAAHIAFFTDSNTIASESGGELYWDSVNNRLGVGVSDPDNVIHAQNDQDGATRIKVENATAGTSALVGFLAQSDTSSGQVNAYSSTHSTAGLADKFVVQSGSDAAHLLLTSQAGDVQISPEGNTDADRALTAVGSTKFVGIGETSPDGRLHAKTTGATSTTTVIEAEGAADSIFPAARIRSTKTSDMADNFGTGLRFQIEDDAATANDVAQIAAIRAGADNTGDLVFQTATTGTLNERARLTSEGYFGIQTNTPTHPLHVAGNALITGNLVVQGTTTSVESENVLLNDNHLYLNNGYTTASGQTAGLVCNYLPTATTDSVNGAYVAGVAATSNPTVTTTGSSIFSAGDLIQFSGATDNDGLFEVLSHTGTTLTIRGVGTTATVEDFTQNQFVAGSSDSATITQVNVSIIRTGTDGAWEIGAGNATPISFSDIGTGTGNISGSGTANHIAYFDGASSIASESGNELYWDSTNNRLGLGTATPESTVQVNGSFATKVNTISTNTTLDDTHHVVLVDASSGDVTLTLPLASSGDARQYMVKKTDSSSNDVIIARSGSDTIDGDTDATLSVQYEARTVISDGTNWYAF